MAYQLVLDALGDPTRRAVFEAVAAQPRAVGAIADTLPVSRPAVSQHLRVLQQAGLVQCQTAGTRRIYSASPDGLADLRRYLDAMWDQALESFKQSIESDGESRGGTDDRSGTD